MLTCLTCAEDTALVCQDRRDCMTFETVNELALKIHMNAGEHVFTKAGAFVTGESFGQRNYRFEKILLGPQGIRCGQPLGSLRDVLLVKICLL